MKDFWRELANLLDEGWEPCSEPFGKIVLDHSGMGVIGLDPVMALACAKNKDRIPTDLDEACWTLKLCFESGKRVREASISPANYGMAIFHRHGRTRQRLLRTLGLPIT